jgi:hypothetical protein
MTIGTTTPPMKSNSLTQCLGHKRLCLVVCCMFWDFWVGESQSLMAVQWFDTMIEQIVSCGNLRSTPLHPWKQLSHSKFGTQKQVVPGTSLVHVQKWLSGWISVFDGVAVVCHHMTENKLLCFKIDHQNHLHSTPPMKATLSRKQTLSLNV